MKRLRENLADLNENTGAATALLSALRPLLAACLRQPLATGPPHRVGLSQHGFIPNWKTQVLLNSIARALWRVRDLAGSGEHLEASGANANRHQEVARENGTDRLNKGPMVVLFLGNLGPPWSR
jgi:hypothetical protein